MNKLTALIEAAEVATPGPWDSEDNNWETSSVYAQGSLIAQCLIDGFACEGTQERYEAIKAANATFIALANPATILELCTLLKQAEEALEKERVSHITTGHTLGARCQELYLLLMQAQTALEIINRTISCNYAGVPEALAAIKQWKEAK